MKTKIRVGTRGSRLAVTQTKQALAVLQQAFPEVTLEIIEITTKGDRLANHSLQAIGGQGAFVKEIEEQLTQEKIDLAVHSLKDVPTILPENLTLACVLKRQNPADCLVFPQAGQTLATLPQGAIVGTSSLRRKAQLLKIRPDLQIKDIRGNIDTRIKKMHDEDFDAIVLAVAGIARLSIEKDLFIEELPLEICIPAVSQGALGMECRKNDAELLAMLKTIEDSATLAAVQAERAFLAKMDGSCTFPIGCYATVAGDEVTIQGMIANSDGSVLLKETLTATDSISAGEKLAAELLAQGAGELIAACRSQN
ncbi:hydroxymethylbilane synthase [Enterococcus sp. PF1-24]|uniref:hydroxymethylbilane synthase n=1 Tax=unclassified Enterococcus TaxID=2608891 RepID=UPI0024757573|nr:MULTISPECIES: hydroxymethylbilane synthase [unclassified Enterococcus]MDH6363372.1 hydroxymethylbilane synthase [Enterococcus sp. PFB1-1]MDH6400327.1 hydroxymethylbilane synthase [Enterococcus sp. PF1-24]